MCEIRKKVDIPLIEIRFLIKSTILAIDVAQNKPLKKYCLINDKYSNLTKVRVKPIGKILNSILSLMKSASSTEK